METIELSQSEIEKLEERFDRERQRGDPEDRFGSEYDRFYAGNIERWLDYFYYFYSIGMSIYEANKNACLALRVSK